MAEYTASPLGLIPGTGFGYESTEETGTRSLFSTRNNFKKFNNKTGLYPHPLSFDPNTHSDEVYNISTSNIIDKLSGYPCMKLKFADFAYCRDYGVYPNNRLVICRRFQSPMIDDLTLAGRDNGSEPISTLISWAPDTESILSFNFGEVWVEAQASFKELLNDVGGDFKLPFKLGDVLFSGADIVPLPGFTEGLQRKILEKLGIIQQGNADIIPSGTPNLIKESKQRQLIKEDQAGSGLMGKVSVTVKCSWEQKFISGVDPTLVYYDILQTILAFGGSQAVFYLGKRSNLGNLDSKLQDFLKPGGATRLIKAVVEAFTDALNGIITEVNKLIRKFFMGDEENSGSSEAKTEDQVKADNEKTVADAQSAAGKVIKGFFDTVIKKYRVQALGIVTTLTGLPSTPWHVTIGNPLRPIFSSGDMLTSDVKVNLGQQLAFNDLPSYIECEFTLTSARNLGIDEIFEKLTCSGVRTSTEAPTFWNTDPEPENTPESTTPGPTGGSTGPAPSESKQEDNTTSNPPGPTGATGGAPTQEQSKVGIEASTGTASTTGETINPDPNSSEPVLGKAQELAPSDQEYTVKPGDSFYKIAKNKLGPNATPAEVNAEMKNIIAKNKNKNLAEADGVVKANQSDPDYLQIGDKLII
jgi:hypothetical protein